MGCDWLSRRGKGVFDESLSLQRFAGEGVQARLLDSGRLILLLKGTILFFDVDNICLSPPSPI